MPPLHLPLKTYQVVVFKGYRHTTDIAELRSQPHLKSNKMDIGPIIRREAPKNRLKLFLLRVSSEVECDTASHGSRLLDKNDVALGALHTPYAIISEVANAEQCFKSVLREKVQP